MDRKGLYKSRLNGKNPTDTLRQLQKMSRKDNRYDTAMSNRNIDELSSPETPRQCNDVTRPIRPVDHQSKPINDRIKRLRELRSRNPAQPKEKRSPFISTVPVGRIIPAKRDIVEKKMEEFRSKVESRMEAESIKKKQISTGKTKRRSGALKKTVGDKGARIVKPVTFKTNSVQKPSNKKRRSSTKKATEIVESPAAGQSHETEPDTEILPVKKRPTFLLPQVPIQMDAQINTPAILGARSNRRTFELNPGQLFLTSTATKVVQQSDNNKKIKLVPEESNFFDGISPLADETLVESEQLCIPEPENAIKFEELNEEPATEKLNVTFNTDESPAVEMEEQKQESDAKQSSFFKRRSWGEFLAENQSPNVVGTTSKTESAETTLGSTQSKSKSRRVTLEDPEQIKRSEIASQFVKILDTQIGRFTKFIQDWTDYKADNELESVAIDMINAAIGQTELLMRKKFAKFRDLIKLFENNHEVEGKRVLADDLDGFWTMVNIEVVDIDKRYDELNKWRDNNWEDPFVTQKQRKKVTTTRPTKKAGKASEGLKALVAQMRAKNKVAPAAPIRDESPPRVQREPATPKRHTPKRRSLNCSGCTPRKSGKKSLSTLVIDSPSVDNKRKSARKSSKKVSMATTSSLEPTLDTASKPLLKTIFQSAIEKSAKKRGSKSVLFAVDENTPSPDTTYRRNKRRIIKTPKASLNHIESEKDEDPENIENDESKFSSPMDMSKVTIERGGRSSRRKRPQDTAAMTNEREDTPISGNETKKARRSTRLFS